eukprot:TRINITY_DN3048_c0_g3_i2.p1 TRINITY_DN3048_c0_g3~~TRINITY_DN3048_c0_g3_i2.p1  ORF type:complete len:136 (-),score=26.58 TRINITY_DN3048_c0_g3_i2:738-1145(-)
MTIYALYIINKSGGMIYQQEFAGTHRLSVNDHMRLASTFHGLHTITSKISPVGTSSGILSLETDAFKLQSFECPTGPKFFIIADPNHPNLDTVLHSIYEVFSDYVLKNPYYVLDMPCRCELFDINLDKLIAEHNK